MPNRYARRANFGHPIRNPLLRKHFVYRMYAADGELIYVGCSQDISKRLAEHSKQSRWWPLADGAIKMAGPFNYETARQIEYDAIEGERPRANYTTERRTLVRVRERMIQARMRVYPPANAADINQYMDAWTAASDVVAAILPDLTDQKLDDLSVVNARRIEAAFVRDLRQGPVPTPKFASRERALKHAADIAERDSELLARLDDGDKP